MNPILDKHRITCRHNIKHNDRTLGVYLDNMNESTQKDTNAQQPHEASLRACMLHTGWSPAFSR